MGETRVDLLHLLEDLRDAYTGPIEETILTEIVANALDSGATVIDLTSDPAARTLTVTDDGSGMVRRELARYHDLASSTKARGRGIGFAGVGIKLGLIVCDEVVTETRRGKSHVASSWRLSSRHRAPWRWIEPPGLAVGRGTTVRLALSNPLSPLLDAGFIETTLRRHFAPLFDPVFDEILGPLYRRGITFLVGGRPLERTTGTTGRRVPIAVRLARKRKPAAVGYLERHDRPLPPEDQGVAVSTFGKVIKRGWDWIGVMPAAPDRVGGLIEAPPLSEALALNKADFIRSGSRGVTYLAFRKAIQEAVAHQIAAWGDDRPAEPPRPAPVRMREIEQVLEQLASDFPLLAALVEQRRGGQRRLPWRGREDAGPLFAAGLVAESSVHVEAASPIDPDEPLGESSASLDPVRPPEAGTQSPTPTSTNEVPAVELPGDRSQRRPGRYGLHVEFESRPGDLEPARLVESTVRVNESHPAYRRAALSRSLGYHIGLSVALALAPLAADPSREHQFLTKFLARWGEAVNDPLRRRRR